MDADEIARRRVASVAVLKARDREEWAAEYQKTCDRMYWQQGYCCAGCDHWQSDSGLTGRCTAAPIMSGADVLRSFGVTFCTYTPPPGHPFTEADHKCGAFSDAFDWSTLPDDYLATIGAMKRGVMHPKPFSPRDAQGGAL
jgi:hypothetical protein